MLKFFIAAVVAVAGYALVAWSLILLAENELPIAQRAAFVAAAYALALLVAAVMVTVLSWQARAKRKRDDVREALKATLGAFPWSKTDDPGVPEALELLRKRFPGAFFLDEDDKINVGNLLRDLQNDVPQAFKDGEMNWDVLLAATRQGQESFDQLRTNFEGAFPIGEVDDTRTQIILDGVIAQFPAALHYDLRDKPAGDILDDLRRYFPSAFPDGKVDWKKLIPRISTLHQVLKDLRGKFKKSFPGGKGPADQKDEILMALRGHFPDLTPDMYSVDQDKQVDWEEFVYSVYGKVAQQRQEATEPYLIGLAPLELPDVPQNSYERELSRFPAVSSGTVGILLATFILMADPTGLIHVAAAVVIVLFAVVAAYKVLIVYPLNAYISPALEERDGAGMRKVNPRRLKLELTAPFARRLVLYLMRSQKRRHRARKYDWYAHPVLLGSSKQGEPNKIEFGELLRLYHYWVVKRADRVSHYILFSALGLSGVILIWHIVKMWWIDG